MPLLDDDQDKALASGQAAIDAFPGLFQREYQGRMHAKLGLTLNEEDDIALIQDLLQLMQEEKADFTLTFRRLSDLANPGKSPDGGVTSVYNLPETFAPWLERWRHRLSQDSHDTDMRQAVMYAANPVFIPRNHLVEEVIRAAEDEGDFEPFNKLVDVLGEPFRFNHDHTHYAMPPRPEQIVRNTFCGT